MIRKEVMEIKKTFAKGNNSLRKLCGCYVHGEAREQSTFRISFQLLEDGDSDKYLKIFQKIFSGSLDKNLFPVNIKSGANNDCYELLNKLIDSQLNDDDALQKFYGKFIDDYKSLENYLILLIHNIYDIPGKATDGTTIDDASDEVFNYIACAVCPVNLTQSGLGYKNNNEEFTSLEQNWIAKLPAIGFLYPAFNDRRADRDEALYFTSNAKCIRDDFVDAFFNSALPLPADQQKESFCEIVKEMFDGEVDYKSACTIKESLDQIIENNEDDPRTESVLKKHNVKNMIESTLKEPIDTDKFDHIFEKILEGKSNLCARNITNANQFDIRTATAQVRINTGLNVAPPDIKIIDGERYILVPVEGTIYVNGIEVSK